MVAACFVAIIGTALGQTADLTYSNTLTADLEYPGRLSATAGGGIYVTDQVLGQVVEYDAGGAVVGTFAIPELPVGIALHPDGRVFVSRADGMVGIYDATFALLGTLDPTPATMAAPNDLAIDSVSGEIYVADAGGHQVLVFDGTTGTLDRMWGTEGSALSEFRGPQAIALDEANGYVLVTDADNYRVQVFDTAGILQYKFGARVIYLPTGGVAWTARGEGLAVDGCGNTYVTDSLMGTIRVFDGTGGELDDDYLPVVGFGSNPGELRNPIDLMIAGTKLYAVNAYGGTVEVYDVSCTAAAPLRGPMMRARSGRRIKGNTSSLVVSTTFRLPDNPQDIVTAMNTGIYDKSLDANRDGRIGMDDLELTVAAFGAATVDDFLNGGMRDAYPSALLPPHMVDGPIICGRCHSMDGQPVGDLTTAGGQENLCLSCHSSSSLANHTIIGGANKGNSHPWGMAADSGDVEGPGVDSDLINHLDNGNVRCGTCHNPHDQEDGEPYLRGTLRGAQLCGECHQSIANQWTFAGHADETADPWSHYDWALPNRAACRKCHSGNGYIDFSKGLANADQNGEFRVLDCAVCHATHFGLPEEELLRVYDETTLPGDVMFTDKGPNATCYTCHNGRTVPDDGGTPHYALGGVMFEGINAVDFGNTSLVNSAHTDLLECVACHMAPSPAAGQPGAGKVGGHSFNLVVHDAADPDFGFENVENACTGCHAGLTTLNRTARGDYDGDGTIEGVQTEVQGLMDLVFDEIIATGAVFLGHYPYWDFSGVVDNPPGFLQTVRDSVWNWEYVDNSGDFGIHNTGYAVGILQLTYEELTGTVLAGAALRYTPDGFTPTADYVGTGTCLGCHGALALTGTDYSPFLRNGHGYKLNEVINGQIPTYPFSSIAGALEMIFDDDTDPSDPKAGTDNTLGTPLTYDDVSFVIGGFGWKSRWIDADGFIVTGSKVQFNLETDGMVAYHNNETDKPYNCGNCHTTGWRHYTSEPGDDRNDFRQNDLPGMDGTFAAAGVQCEACHGAGSLHAIAPSTANITLVAAERATADFLAPDMAYGKAVACSECHIRDSEKDYPTYVGGPGRIAASGGLIKHHEQYEEMIGIDPDDVPGGPTGPHKNLTCMACHNPHTTTRYQDISGDASGMNKDCADCHNATGIGGKDYEITSGGMTGLDCTDCHMPKITKSAVGHAAVGTGPVTGDIKTHIFRIDISQTDQFTPDGSFAYPWVTGEFACKTCHNTVDAFDLTFPVAITIH